MTTSTRKRWGLTSGLGAGVAAVAMASMFASSVPSLSSAQQELRTDGRFSDHRPGQRRAT